MISVESRDADARSRSRAGAAPSASRAAGSRGRRRRTRARTRSRVRLEDELRDLRPARSRLSAQEDSAMIASGTTIERIVRGWRRRRPSEIGATSVGSSSSGARSAIAAAVARRIGGRAAGVASIAPDPTGPAVASTGRPSVRWSCPAGRRSRRRPVARSSRRRPAGRGRCRGRAGRPWRSGVQQRGRSSDARPGTSSAPARAASRPSGVDGSPSSAV